MLVTIGVFVYNELELLKKTLKALEKNTDLPYDLIVVDDGSDTSTNSYLRKLNNITLISNTRRMGYPHCANLVLDHSSTPYILFLDSASYVVKGWLSLMINTLKANSSYGIAGPSTNLAWGKQCIVQGVSWTDLRIEQQGEVIKEQWGNKTEGLNILHNVSSFCYFFKRDVFNAIGYFDEAYGLGQCEEIDYATRAYKAGFKAVWVCGAYVHRFIKQRFGHDAAKLLERNKEIYQNKFCLQKITINKADYCSHCLAEECEFFVNPRNLKKVVRFPLSFKIKYPKESNPSERKSVIGVYPLVSCIMPTADRPIFVSKAIEYFLRQDYGNKELIVVDDGIHKVRELVPVRDDIKYIQLNKKTALGEKRNIAIENSNGQIITHWDDDDWYASNRIRLQLDALRKEKADICALKPGLYYDVKEDEFWQCKEGIQDKFYYAGVIGGSMFYLKEIWDMYVKFPSSANLGEDAYFLKKLPKHSKLVKLNNKSCYIYIRHTNNTWQFNCGKDFIALGWSKVMPPVEISSSDLMFYRSLSTG